MQLNEVFLQSLQGKRYKKEWKTRAQKQMKKTMGEEMETGKKEEWNKEGTKQGWKGNGYILQKTVSYQKLAAFSLH